MVSLLPLRLKDRLPHGWVIVVAFFIFGMTSSGIRLSFGIFFKSIENEFTLSRAGTSAVVSLFTILGIAFAILGGWALDRYGPRIIVLSMGLSTGAGLFLTGQTNAAWQLFFTYSLLLAVGMGATYVVMMSTILRWFDRKQGLALGIASSGTGLGMVVMAPFATFLISNFDWRMAYVVLGFIAWSFILPLTIIVKHPDERKALSNRSELRSVDLDTRQFATGIIGKQMVGLSLVQALRTRNFWLIMFVWVFAAFNLILVLTHLVPHTTDIGFSAVEAAMLMSLIGGIAIAGRILMGTLSDRITSKKTTIVCSLLLAGAMACLVWARDLWMLYIVTVLFGLAFGGMVPSIAALCGEVFGLHNIGSILGLLEVGFGIGAAIGPLTGGLIFDIDKSYSIAFSIGALIMCVVPLLLIQIRQETDKNT